MEIKPYWANVAFGCLLSVIAAVVLTRKDITLANGMLIWLLFMICIGLSFSAGFQGRQSVGKAALLISLALLAALCFKGAAEIMIKGGYFYVASIGEVSVQEMKNIDNLKKYAAFYFAIFLLTIPGLTVAIFARKIVIDLLTKLFSITEGRLKTITNILNYSIKIISIVLGAILALK
ncbi:hypothetical protein BDD43_2164 [Mucilaginibacter gracilis]|uniref:Uncharacterized protein n=1 Tax=Mucilaginibacter gracilis TaxID=423350 RepID=A0A495IZ45_9SPHI|nr:hypothetical protein [Mucilaginibacter gracilis]RKR82000.1 hypothetical protein BDD43_2164 [Mucilaginibacter gracilis]